MTVVNIPAKSTPARMTLSMIRTMPTAISLIDLLCSGDCSWACPSSSTNRPCASIMIPMPRARFKSITIKVLIAVFAASEPPPSSAMTTGMAYMDSIHTAQADAFRAAADLFSVPVIRSVCFFINVFIRISFFVLWFMSGRRREAFRRRG